MTLQKISYSFFIFLHREHMIKRNPFTSFIFVFVTITTIGYGYNTIADDVPEFIKLEGHTDCVWSAVFSPDGKNIVTASRDNTARIWETAT
ncbi:MAG: hypothetical protein LBK82_09185, partial [Planctomycetaceae bacterium]|nr:hypothetical protein [Planctomycetaceae bacterium]